MSESSLGARARSGAEAFQHAAINGGGEPLVVHFEDNRLVLDLLGEYDGHLAVLEDRLGIEAMVHGNVVTLTGPAKRLRHRQVGAGKALWPHRAGRDIGAGEVDGAIRHARAFEPSETARPAAGSRARRSAPRKRLITARTPTQSAYIASLERNDLVFGIGPAGTGKTYLAVAFAAHCLERGRCDRMILSRPAVEAGERLGFLPGDMREKVDPYLRPLYDALYDMLPPEQVERGLATGVIEIAPLAFMRGRTLAHAFVILDEAQNCTRMQMKMFLTRLGEESKMIVTGDPSQVDLPPGKESGLLEAIGLLKGIEEIDHIAFTRADVVRRELVGKIVDAYESAPPQG